MMFKINLLFRTLVLVLVLLVPCCGCAKKNIVKNVSSRLYGTWKGTDSVGDSVVISLYNDGTFEFSALGFSAAGTYKYVITENKMVFNAKVYRSIKDLEDTYVNSFSEAKIVLDSDTKITISSYSSGSFFTTDDALTAIKQYKTNPKTFDFNKISSNSTSTKSSVSDSDKSNSSSNDNSTSSDSSDSNSPISESETNSSSNDEEQVYSIGDTVNISDVDIYVNYASQSNDNVVAINISANNLTGKSNSFMVSSIVLETNGSNVKLDIWRCNLAGIPFLNGSELLGIPFESDGAQKKSAMLYFEVDRQVNFNNCFLLIPKPSDDVFVMEATYIKMKLVKN